MADLSYSIGVNTAQGVQALKNLQNQVQATNSVFASMKEAVVGLASLAFVQNLLSMADSLSDAATAAGVSTEALMGFSRAVGANGGEVNKAIAGMAKFSETLGGAKEGSKQAQDTLLKLGIGLDKLARLSEEDLLRETIRGIAAIEDPSKRAAAGVDAFGKAAKGVDWRGVASDIDRYTSSSKEAAAAVETAGQVNDMLSGAYKDLQVQILIALKPIAELAKAIMAQKDAVAFVIKVLADLAVAFAVFKIVLPAIRAGIAAVNGFAFALEAGGVAASNLGKFVSKEINNMGQGFKGLLGAITGINYGFGSVATAGSRLATGFAALLSIGLRFASWIGIFLMIYDVVNAVVRLITGSGIAEWADKAGKALANIFGIKYQTEAEKAAKKQEEIKNTATEVVDAYKQQRDAIKDIVEQFDKQNTKSSEQLRLETELIGKSKEYQDQRRAQFNLDQSYKETLDKLTEARDKLTAAELRAGLGKNYDTEIARLKKLREEAQARSKEDVKNNTAAVNAEQLRLFGQQAEIENFKELQGIRDRMAKSTMSELEQRKFELEISARQRFQDKVNEEERRLGRRLTEAEREAYKQKALVGLKELQDAAEQEYVASRQFSTGWSQAFRQYVDDATNAAQQAQRIFQSATQGMEDLLMGFFKTGKWGWKDFVQNIIDVMMRSQIQQLIAKTFGGIGSVGGGRSGGGGLFGGAIIPGFLASGGPVSSNKPYIVGERGPELFLPNTSGSMIPNNQLGGGTVTYNINAVDAMSFKQMLAQDPTFLHAVAEQGRRRLPGAR